MRAQVKLSEEEAARKLAEAAIGHYLEDERRLKQTMEKLEREQTEREASIKTLQAHFCPSLSWRIY